MVHVFNATPNSLMTASIVATVALDDWRHRWIGTKSMKFPRHTKIRQEAPSERESSLGRMLRVQNFRGRWRQQLQVLLPPLCLLSKRSRHRNSGCRHRCRRHPAFRQPQPSPPLKLERKLQRYLCPGKWSPRRSPRRRRPSRSSPRLLCRSLREKPCHQEHLRLSQSLQLHHLQPLLRRYLSVVP